MYDAKIDIIVVFPSPVFIWDNNPLFGDLFNINNIDINWIFLGFWLYIISFPFERTDNISILVFFSFDNHFFMSSSFQFFISFNLFSICVNSFFKFCICFSVILPLFFFFNSSNNSSVINSCWFGGNNIDTQNLLIWHIKLFGSFLFKFNIDLISAIFSSESSIKLYDIEFNIWFIFFSSKEINVPSSINSIIFANFHVLLIPFER